MSLLDKLKTKPKPAKRHDVTLTLGDTQATQKDEVKLDVPVVIAKTAVNVDRRDILKRLGMVVPVVEKSVDIPKAEAEAATDRDTQDIVDLPKEDVPVEVKPTKRTVAKKLPKRLKLVEKEPIADLTDVTIADTQVPKKTRRTRKPTGVADIGPTSMLKIGKELIGERVKEPEATVTLRASSYYMANREIFTSFIASLFGPYKEQMVAAEKEVTCASRGSGEQSLFLHQQIVRDYLNLYTPYRGLLLYHGLGSGKTCASIGIAEGMKSNKKVFVMTPASLQANYRNDLKKCGDLLYRKNQFWEFVKVTASNEELTKILSSVLSLPMELIRKNKGAWMVNVNKPSNFGSLSASEKASLDAQLDEMINHKYRFINYNGIRSSHLSALSNGYTTNPFDNSVIVIDEAHNFVSRIVNKINKPDSLSFRMYQYIMNAENARIVLLTGTPIINYPNEIGIMFNILRGKIKTWYFKLSVSTQKKISEASLKTMFSKMDILDYLEYRATSNTLVVTRNPFGFYSVSEKQTYKGVTIGDRGEVTDDGFVSIITSILKKNNIDVIPSATRVEMYKALPDTLEEFQDYFIDPKTNEMKNNSLFKRRILGLTSYYRSAQEKLMPKFDKGKDFHVVKVPMSDFQFGIYEEARIQERKLEKNNARRKKNKKGVEGELYKDSVSTYRIFSRAFCNFVFPRPNIVRPMPNDGQDIETALAAAADEDLLDAATVQERINNVDGRFTADEAESLPAIENQDATYEKRIQNALQELRSNAHKYLTPAGLQTYSPKFLSILENILDADHVGLHMIYSQFRTLEGIGILALVLEANGFARFTIKRDAAGAWQLDISDANKGKPMFALYTGTETSEEREIVRNIFNSAWDLVPTNIANELKTMSENNHLGEVIKVLMITASGAEGINLKNVRYVHITEPYWHPVRIEQAIGRARRICSHEHLPVKLQTVTAFIYLMVFSDKQLTSDESIELRLNDKSKIDKSTPVTTDQALYEIATIKEDINKQILTSVKEAAIDCSLHTGKGNKEKLKCFSFGRTSAKKFAYQPSITSEESDTVADVNRTMLRVKARSVTIDGIEYAYNADNGDIYDMDSYIRGDPITVGHLKVEGKKYVFTKI
jgi:hypothetical protein